MLSNYDDYVFDDMQFLANSCDGPKFVKAIFMAWAVTRFVLKLLFCRTLKIVHIHTSSYFSFRRSVYFARIAKLFGKKVIMHVHSGKFSQYYAEYPSFVEKGLTYCDKIVALTPTWKDFFASIFDPHDVVVIPNPVPKMEKPERKYSGKINFLFLGFVSRDKGAKDLLEMVVSHKRQLNKKAQFTLCGNDVDCNVGMYIRENHLGDLVIYRGWVDGEEKQKIFDSHDVLVLPSYAEGMPMTIIEAMANGMPVIASNVGGIPEIINDNENGQLIVAGNKEELYAAVTRYLNNRDLIKQHAEVAIHTADKYSPELVANNLMSLYDDMA